MLPALAPLAPGPAGPTPLPLPPPSLPVAVLPSLLPVLPPAPPVPSVPTPPAPPVPTTVPPAPPGCAALPIVPLLPLPPPTPTPALPPETPAVSLRPAARLRQLAEGNPIADYLRFVAQIVDAQAKAAGQLTLAEPDAALIARAQELAMTLLPAADDIDAAWHGVLDRMLDALSGADGLPAPLQPLLQELRALDTAGRDEIAQRLLQKEVAARHVGMAPFVMAALQVVFATRASGLSARDLPYTDPPSICPVCASEPVASVLRIGGKAAGHRYLHCGTCCTEWHMVRVKCSHCESTKGVEYQGIDGAGDTVLAETCEECGSYRKVVNQEKDRSEERRVGKECRSRWSPYH